MNVINKGIVITGAASGMGLACAKHLHALDAKLCLIDVQENILKKIAKELKANFFVASVTDENLITEVITKFNTHTPIHGLINCAGKILAKKICSEKTPL